MIVINFGPHRSSATFAADITPTVKGKFNFIIRKEVIKMRTVQFERLRPHEILEAKKQHPVAYLPIGPLEWHGPHLSVGMDPLNAHGIATRIAENVGGVVLPTLYWGTERERSPKMLKNIGFNGDEWIVGMDFPANSMKSMYAREDIFGVVVREYLRMLVEQGYKLIVLINGHGAENHIQVLERLAKEFTATSGCRVHYVIALIQEDGVHDLGHATCLETSIMAHLHPDCVDVNQLPPKNQPMKNVDFAIVDHEAFSGHPNDDYTVIHDPREANADMGKNSVEYTVHRLSKEISDILDTIK